MKEFSSEVCMEDFELASVQKELKSAVESYNEETVCMPKATFGLPSLEYISAENIRDFVRHQTRAISFPDTYKDENDVLIGIVMR